MTEVSMGDHQPDGSQAEGTVPEEQTADSSTGEKHVPLSELVKQRQAAAEAKKRAEEQEARIRELEERLAAVDKGQKPEDKPEVPPADDASTSKESDPATLSKLDEILRKDAIRDLRDEHGLTQQQAEKVHEIMNRMPDLNYDEAHAIAASRNIDLFTDGSQAGYNPSIHGATRPAPQGPPADPDTPDTPKRLEAIKKLRGVNKSAAASLWSNLVGDIAAKQIGIEGHKRLDIPEI